MTASKVDEARRKQEALIQEHRAKRRTDLAPGVTLRWESQTTIDHDEAEMLWAEEDLDVRRSIRAGYSALRPTPGRLTATLAIGSSGERSARQQQVRYAGLAQAITVVMDEATLQARIIGTAGTAEAAADRMHIAFDLPAGAELHGARLVVAHPHLTLDVVLPEAVRRSHV